MRSLRDWKPGDNVFNNDHHQQAVLALRELDAQAAYRGPPRDYVFREEWPARIVTAGPAAEADWTDERYWCQKIYLRGTTTPTDTLVFGDDKGPDPIAGATNTIVAGTNLAEFAGHTHGLEAGRIVWVRAYQDYGNPSFKRYVFTDSAAGPAPVLAKVTSQLGTGGQYSLALYDVGATDADGAGDLALPESLTAEADQVLGLSIAETGFSTHWYPAGAWGLAVKLPGMSTEAIPRPVYLFVGGSADNGQPVDVGDSDMDSSSDSSGMFSDAAATWSVRDGTGTVGNGVPVSIAKVTNVVVEGGNLYVERRAFSYDADGRLSNIGEGNVSTYAL